MKKILNDPARVVDEALAGMAAAHGDLLDVHLDPHYITRKGGAVQGKVAVLSGGGSGHEPMHGGFVGRGMLAAACPGARSAAVLPAVAFGSCTVARAPAVCCDELWDSVTTPTP